MRNYREYEMKIERVVADDPSGIIDEDPHNKERNQLLITNYRVIVKEANLAASYMLNEIVKGLLRTCNHEEFGAGSQFYNDLLLYANAEWNRAADDINSNTHMNEGSVLLRNAPGEFMKGGLNIKNGLILYVPKCLNVKIHTGL